MTATASAATATIDEDLDECGPQLINKLEVSSYQTKQKEHMFFCKQDVNPIPNRSAYMKRVINTEKMAFC